MRRRARICCWMLGGLLAAVSALSCSVCAATRPGVIRVEVDASQSPQRLLHSHLTIPVQPGPLTLLFPEWIPGEHMPDGPINNIAGLKFTAGKKALTWRRDLLDMFAFHLTVPPGVTSLDVRFDFLISGAGSGYSSGASSTAYLNDLSWNQVILYPRGFAAKDLTYVASLKLPAGWKFGTALPGATRNGDTIAFDPCPLSTLVDSPVLSGRFFRVIPLAENPPHEIDIAADSEVDLAMTAETEAAYRHLISEAGALFGSRHYRDYHFLLTLSDNTAHFGLEHHESSDDRSYEKMLIDPNYVVETSGLLPHEFVHSWNGKYRRPEDLATADFHQPMRDDLLWVYEGLTEYWGDVLTARSGLYNSQQAHEMFASLVAKYDHEPGRDWRPLQDTADAAVVLYDASHDWENWRREVDFYDESVLLWLDVDTTIRRLTKDKKSLNDFSHAFHGGPGGEPALKTYAFEDVVAGLNSVAPNDWTSFLRTRLDSVGNKMPDQALLASGWQVIYNDQANEIERMEDIVHKSGSFMYSVGLAVEDDGVVRQVLYDGPAFKAGLGPGMKITEVAGKKFTLDELKNAIAASTSTPVQLTVKNGPQVQGYTIDYHGGARYPHLERAPNRPDLLDEILHPLAQ